MMEKLLLIEMDGSLLDPLVKATTERTDKKKNYKTILNAEKKLKENCSKRRQQLSQP